MKATTRALFGVPGTGFDAVYCRIVFETSDIQALTFDCEAWFNGMIPSHLHLFESNKRVKLFFREISPS